MGIRLEEYQAASSLAVQWLRLHLPKQGVQVRFLVCDLRSHMPPGKKKTKQRNSIVTNSVKTFKMIHIKIKKKKKNKTGNRVEEMSGWR